MSARIAIVGTPRSGNMWLRRLLLHSCGGAELSADTPAAVPWSDLPPAVVLQLHWFPDDGALELLDRHGFAPVVVARHPLDVLVSILQFAQHEGRTARWLNGAHGNELSLVGADPTAPEFRAYALSQRAAALLAITPAWRDSAALAAHVRYEDLVQAPAEQLERLLAELGVRPANAPAAALAASGLVAMRTETGNGHVWRGQPGAWRELLVPALARELAAAHPAAFAAFGYTADADESLDAERARATWRALARPPAGPSRRDDVAARVDAHRAVQSSAAETVVAELYRLVLRRQPDPGGAARATSGLAGGTLSPAALLAELVETPEARRIRMFDDALAFARWAQANGERPRELRSPPGTDESAISTMWALSRYRGEPDVLDVGTAHAEPAYVAALAALGARVTGLDAAPFAFPGIEAVTADVRTSDLPAHRFDVAFCLGTLHHLGCDNRPFGLPAEHDADGPRRGLSRLRRQLRSSGRLLVSVPCGAERDHGLFVQHTPETWLGLFAAAGFFVFEHELYELGPDGWGAVETVGELAYGERGPGASAVLCAELRPGRIRQSARRQAAQLAALVR